MITLKEGQSLRQFEVRLSRRIFTTIKEESD
jgi:hypothetical protein